MPRKVAPLTDTAIRNAKPKDKPYKLFDGGGLYLEIRPNGGKWWRFKFIANGKENRLGFGTYPETSLKSARDQRDEARNLKSAGINPSVARKASKAAKAERAANSFEVVAREWIDNIHRPETKPEHAERTLRRFERDIFPTLGAKPISDIKAPELLTCIKRIQARGVLYTAHRALTNCGQVFRYAITTGRVDTDITAFLKGALPSAKGGNFAAVTEPAKVGELLRTLDDYQGTLTVSCALRLAPLVFVRPGELRRAEWAAIDFDAAEWRYLVTKTETPHIVPLSRQAIGILREIQSLTGNGRYVFPSARSSDRPMSDNAILAAMRRLDIPADQMTGHGFRAMARTILDEVLGFRVDYIEHQLAHSVKDANGRAYNRTSHIKERAKMMQAWADYLDKLKAGATVAQLPITA